MPYKDVVKQRAAWNRWYHKNKQKKVRWQVKRRREVTDWVSSLKVKCRRCPEKHPACLTFHHVTPSKKEMEIAVAIQHGWSKERLLKEMKKCIVLCFNCHTKHHWKQRRKNRQGVA